MSSSTKSSTAPEVLAIIASFKRPDYRVADMEADGFTHVRSRCPDCDQAGEMPFRFLRHRNRISDDTTLEAISRAYSCSSCKGRLPAGWLLQPSYQYMGTGVDTGTSPVNRRLPASRWFVPKP
jgi:hypothetical protein